MRIQPSDKTLKKLFALSGNRCAFPGCKEFIVDEDQNLIGQVCHIEAAETGGERYNPNQTDKERADFSNLILLCANHHIVTNDVDTYTVEVLKEMKKKHEAENSKTPFTPTDETLKKAALQILNQNNVNSGSGQQINYQAKEITVQNNGVSASEVVKIVQTLFNDNFPSLVEKASQKASENVTKFKQEISTQVGASLTADDLEKFSEPDVQFVLNEAVMSAARNDDEDLHKTLSKLIVTRVKENNIDIKRVVLNGAISTAGKLTLNQMKIITLSFLMKNTRFMSVRNWEGLKNNFEIKIKPFIDFSGTQSELLYLQYTGCGNVETLLTTDIVAHLRATYGAVFVNSYTDEEIKGLNLPEEITKELFVRVDDRTIPNVDGINELRDFLKNKEVENSLIENAVSIYESKLPSQEDIKSEFEKEIGWTKQLFELFQSTTFNKLTLTSVGMAIALAFYEQQIGQALNMETWIN